MRRLYFLVCTAGLTVLFLVAMWQDTNREWTAYQRTFRGTLERAERRAAPAGIQQIVVKDLDRVDRCTTCHVAIERPQLALAEEPFTAHPGDYLKWHPVEKFGCTICHGGQGLATEVKAAHGDVPHWEQPLLRGPLVQASCNQCHGDLQEIASHAPVLLQGRALFKEQGCYGCHTVKDFGQTVSVDLTQVGSKSHLLMEADFENMPHPHNRIHWLATKLNHPRQLNPGVRQEDLPLGEEEVFPSAMPHFGLQEDEVQALTAYLLGLTELDPPASYTTPPRPEPAPVYTSQLEQGQAVFNRLGCTGCHGADGLGGRRNWNGGLGEEVPSLLYVKAYYADNIDALKTVIRSGRQPVPRADVHRPNPGLYMPAWKDRMNDQELDALVAYLFSLADRLPQPPAAPSEAPPGDAMPSEPLPDEADAADEDATAARIMNRRFN